MHTLSSLCAELDLEDEEFVVEFRRVAADNHQKR